MTEKEANHIWNLDYAAGILLQKANPGPQFFTVWVKARMQSPDKKWNVRLVDIAMQASAESIEDLEPLFI